MDEITVEAENKTSEGRVVGTEAVDGNSNVKNYYKDAFCGTVFMQ